LNLCSKMLLHLRVSWHWIVFLFECFRLLCKDSWLPQITREIGCCWFDSSCSLKVYLSVSYAFNIGEFWRCIKLHFLMTELISSQLSCEIVLFRHLRKFCSLHSVQTSAFTKSCWYSMEKFDRSSLPTIFVSVCHMWVLRLAQSVAWACVSLSRELSVDVIKSLHCWF